MLRSNPPKEKSPRIKLTTKSKYLTTPEAGKPRVPRTKRIIDYKGDAESLITEKAVDETFERTGNTFRGAFECLLYFSKDGKEFIMYYCLARRINSVLYNEYANLPNSYLPKLFTFIEPLKRCSVNYAIYKTNGARKKTFDNLLSDIKNQLYVAALYQEGNPCHYSIESKYSSFTANYIVNLLYCIYFFNTKWDTKDMVFKELDLEKNPYQCIVLQRKVTKTITMYLPLVRDDNTFEKVRRKDTQLTTPWTTKSGKEMNRLIFNKRCVLSRSYFEGLIEELHTTLFPPINVK